MADRTVVVYLKANDQLTPAFQKASSAAKSLGKEVTSGTDQARKGIAGLGISAKQIAGGLGFAGIAVGVGKLATSFVGFGTAMSGVSAATMATAGDLDRLRQAALEAGQGTQYSATEAAQGITELAKAGVSTADIMGGGLAGALSLAAAGGLEVAAAAEISATALKIFGLEGSQMTHVADLLAAGAGKAQGSVNDMSMALNQSALVAKNTGLSVEATTGALALFASNGLLGSDAGTSFKTMLTNLNPRSKEAAALMDDLGLRAYDASGQFVGLATYAQNLRQSLMGMSAEQRNATLQTIFGTDAIRAATILYDAGANGVNEWARKVNDSGYAAEQAARLTDNLAGDLERLKGALENAFIAGGGKADASLRKLVQQLTEMVPELAKAVIALFNIGSAFASVAAAGLTAFGPLLSILGSLAELVGALPAPVQAAALSFLLFSKNKDTVMGFFTGISNAFRGFKDEMAVQAALATTVSGGYKQLGDEAHNSGKRLSTFSAAAATARARLSTLAEAVGPAVLTAGLGALVAGLAVGINMIDEATAAQKALNEAWLEGGNTAAKVAKDFDRVAYHAEKAGGFVEFLANIPFVGSEISDFAAESATNLMDFAQSAGVTGVELLKLHAQQQQVNAAVAQFGEYSPEAKEELQLLAEMVGEYTDEAAPAAEATSGLTDLVANLGGVTQETTDKVGALQEAFEKLVDPAINADQALIAQIEDYYKLIDVVQKKIDAGDAEAVSLSFATASGRENIGMIGDQITKLKEAAIARAIESGSAAQGMEIWNQGTAALRDQLVAMGFLPAEVDALLASYNTIPAEIGTAIELETQTATDNLAAWIAANSNKTISANVKLVYDASQVTAADQYIKAPGGKYADGGFAYFGKGGFASFAGGKEAHYAHIAGAGTNRMWAEPETGGEGYVPLGQSKRAQSKAIVQQIVDRFGGQVAWAPERSIPPAMAAAGQMSKIARSTGETVTALQEQVIAITNVLQVDGQVLHKSVQHAKRDRDRRGGPS